MEGRGGEGGGKDDGGEEGRESTGGADLCCVYPIDPATSGAVGVTLLTLFHPGLTLRKDRRCPCALAVSFCSP